MGTPYENVNKIILWVRNILDSFVSGRSLSIIFMHSLYTLFHVCWPSFILVEVIWEWFHRMSCLYHQLLCLRLILISHRNRQCWLKTK